jgi:transcriptional regulator with XRE-family HTH domain
LGIRKKRLSAFEDGTKDIDSSCLFTLCALLEMDPDAFIKGELKEKKDGLSWRLDLKGFGEKAAKAREQAGFTEVGEADELGIDKRDVYAYERGEKTPPMRVLAKMCALYKMTPTELLSSGDEALPIENEKPNKRRTVRNLIANLFVALVLLGAVTIPFIVGGNGESDTASMSEDISSSEASESTASSETSEPASSSSAESSETPTESSEPLPSESETAA